MFPDERSFAPPESAHCLWYYPSINRFTDDDGNVLHDLHDLFDVWQLEEWKRTQDYGILRDRNGGWCELYYPSEFEEWELLQQLNNNIGYNEVIFERK